MLICSFLTLQMSFWNSGGFLHVGAECHQHSWKLPYSAEFSVKDFFLSWAQDASNSEDSGSFIWSGKAGSRLWGAICLWEAVAVELFLLAEVDQHPGIKLSVASSRSLALVSCSPLLPFPPGRNEESNVQLQGAGDRLAWYGRCPFPSPLAMLSLRQGYRCGCSPFLMGPDCFPFPMHPASGFYLSDTFPPQLLQIPFLPCRTFWSWVLHDKESWSWDFDCPQQFFRESVGNPLIAITHDNCSVVPYTWDAHQ